MADISNVHTSEIKEIFDSLESLSCKYIKNYMKNHTDKKSSNFDTRPVLISLIWERRKELAFGRLHSTGVRAASYIGFHEGIQHKQQMDRKNIRCFCWCCGAFNAV